MGRPNANAQGWCRKNRGRDAYNRATPAGFGLQNVRVPRDGAAQERDPASPAAVGDDRVVRLDGGGLEDAAPWRSLRGVDR